MFTTAFYALVFILSKFLKNSGVKQASLPDYYNSVTYRNSLHEKLSWASENTFRLLLSSYFLQYFNESLQTIMQYSTGIVAISVMALTDFKHFGTADFPFF